MTQPSPIEHGSNDLNNVDAYPKSRRHFLNVLAALTSIFGSGLLLSGTPRVARAAAGMPYPRDEFERYLTLFSNNAEAACRRYCTDDMVYERGDHTLLGVEEIVAFYREVHAHAHQKIELVNYAATDTFIGAEVYSEFEAFKDWSHPSGVIFKKGEFRRNHNFVHYDLRDGRIAHIKSTSLKRLVHKMP